VFTHVKTEPSLDNRSLILGDCVKFSNVAVYEAAQSNPANHNMGTTLVAALWLDDRLAVANVGDSRLYVVRKGEITQCTTDHSFVQEQVDRGLLKPEEAEKSNLRNMLTRSVGVDEDVDVDVLEVNVSDGDYVLLCSDGLTKMLDDDQIKAVFDQLQDPEKISDELIRRANEAGGGDNITVVVARLDCGPSGWASLADRLKSIFTRKQGAA
jgi:protein phosphatase